MTTTAEQAPQVHRTAVRFQCPEGHTITTQAASGQPVKCSGCLAAGETVLVEVPRRPGEAAKPVRPPESASPPDAPVSATCRGCGATAPGALPLGWISLVVGAGPASQRGDRTHRRAGVFCSARCAAAGLHHAVTKARVRAVPLKQHSDRGELARLMTERPRGRAS